MSLFSDPLRIGKFVGNWYSEVVILPPVGSGDGIRVPIYPKGDRAVSDMPEALFPVLAPLGHVGTIDGAIPVLIPAVVSSSLNSGFQMRLADQCFVGMFETTQGPTLARPGAAAVKETDTVSAGVVVPTPWWGIERGVFVDRIEPKGQIPLVDAGVGLSKRTIEVVVRKVHRDVRSINIGVCRHGIVPSFLTNASEIREGQAPVGRTWC